VVMGFLRYMKIVQGRGGAARKTGSYVKSVPVYSLCPVPYGDDCAVISQHRIGIEVRLDLLERVAGNLSTKFVSGAVIEEENGSSSVIMGLTPEVEQALHDIGRNTPLLKPGLSMVRDR
jgi:hypothetical protein